MESTSVDSLEADKQYELELRQLFRDLKTAAVVNIEYFQNAKGANNERFFTCFSTLWDHIQSGIEPATIQLLTNARNFDYNLLVRANGYRSLIKVIQKCCLHLLQLCRHISSTKETMLFRGTFYCKELDAYVTVLGQLRACTFYAQKFSAYCHEGQLFPDVNSLSEKDSKQAALLMTEVEALCQEPFFGRCLGFHYCSSMKMPLTTVSLAMASFGDGYLYNSTMMKFASSMYSGSKYMMDPELRAKQFVRMTRTDDVSFCKSFWSLTENALVHNLPLIVCPPVQVDLTIDIQPDVIELPAANGERFVPIHPPCAHSGPGPVSARLISYMLHEGQESWLQRDGKPVRHAALPLSPGLIIHIHGGGFVSQSSASHEVYLRQWAKDTDTPILSIDYSLAPEEPFPRQLEEVFFAYCWALKNAYLLGSTAERVAIVGDSAGGNLGTSVAMRCAMYGVRVPDGLLTVYGCFMVQYAPSPSRILSLMDPLLPLGVLAQVLAAYSGVEVSLSSDHFLVAGASSSSETLSDTSTVKSNNESEPSASQHCAGVDNESVSTAALAPLLTHIPQYRPAASRDSGYIEDMCSVEQDVANTSNRSAFSSLTDVNKKLSSSEDGSAPSVFSTRSVSAHAIMTPVINIQEVPEHSDCEPNGEAVHDVCKPEVDQNCESSSNRSDLISKLRIDLGNWWSRLGSQRRASTTSLPVTPGSKTPVSVRSIDDEIASPFLSCRSSPCSSPELGTSSPTYAKMRHFAQSPVDFFKHLPVLSNPYMSPLLAPDDMLDRLCPVYLIACHLDPLLDDSVMFAKRLTKLGHEVHLDLIDDLSHGFLNFVLVCPEARRASALCVKRLRQIVGLDSGIINGSNDEETIVSPTADDLGWVELNDDDFRGGVETAEECGENWQLGGP